MTAKGTKAPGGVRLASREAPSVAECANIYEIRLFASSVELKGFTTEGPFHWDLRIAPSTIYKEGDPYFVVVIRYDIAIEKPSDADTEGTHKNPEEIADISFQFGMLCELNQGSSRHKFTSAEVEEYSKTVATANLNPYAREYVHDVTMRMGLPPLVMDIRPSFFAEETVKRTENADDKTSGE